MSTTTAFPAEIEITPPPSAPRVEWRRAWRAVKALMETPDRTELAFEAIAALSGSDWERRFQRFAADDYGRALLAAKPSLLGALSDRDALRAMPEGSFGRAYARFMDEARLDAAGLVDAETDSLAGEHIDELDPHRAFFSHRVRDMHDLWHVLTGYGRDEAGEAANLAFTYAQIPQRGIALILLAIVLRPAPDGHTRLEWVRYLLRAYRRGRRATWLPIAPYEQLLSRPLGAVRQTLGIEPAQVVHPHGIIIFDGAHAA